MLASEVLLISMGFFFKKLQTNKKKRGKKRAKVKFSQAELTNLNFLRQNYLKN